ncbi:MAG: ferrous iron transport protein B [Deltaproteobacteria bacterium]|nr:ferrous iron transport protein B [Deltaproteobacteria bacterium]
MNSGAQNIFLVGNPNVGKSVIFGCLTGSYATVSNYPGTTVALSKGEALIEGHTYQVIDTPGINSLIPMSEDESVTRNVLLDNDGFVIQVADAKNLMRALPLTFQLQEMGVRMVLVINMCDEAAKTGIKIDAQKLEAALGIPIITTVATQKLGIPLLKERLKEAKVCRFRWKYSPVFEEAIQYINDLLPEDLENKHSLAGMLLAGDKHIHLRLKIKVAPTEWNAIEAKCQQVAAQFAEPVSFLLNRERSALAQSVLGTTTTTTQSNHFWKNKLSAWTMHPFIGIVILAGILEAVYLFVGKFGAGTAVNFIENNIFGRYISPPSIWLFDHLCIFPHTHELKNGLLLGAYTLNGQANIIVKTIHDCFVGPYGLITMGLSYGIAIVLPIVTTFFIAFSLMEDSGYLPRLAVMVNRLFKWMGLNGKAVLPMVLGLGCDTMATLTTRILESKKQRVIVTLLLALAVPCSAQLGVLLGMFGTMPMWTFWVWLCVMGGVMFFVGFACDKILKGEGNAFVMEIPPLRVPQFSNVAKKTLSHLEWYVKEAIPLFLLGTFILFLLDALHLLTSIQKLAAPLVVKVLGLPMEASNAFLIGFLRRDYGATGFFDMYSHGRLTVVQALVALVVITLFVPCVANVFMMVKEHGGKVAARMVFFIFPFAFLVGGILNWILR